MNTTPVVRPITEADIPTAIDTLTRAFADYPYTRHVIAADDHEQRIRRFQEICLTRIAMTYGRVWIAEDGRAVAAWTPPDTDPTPAFADIGPALIALTGDRQPQYESAEHALADHRPQQPAWCLDTVAVAPDAQRHGLGTAVLAPGITQAQTDGHPAYLETSSPDNLPFYQHLGFQITATVPLPDNGPRTWCMVKNPL